MVFMRKAGDENYLLYNIWEGSPTKEKITKKYYHQWFPQIVPARSIYSEGQVFPQPC